MSNFLNDESGVVTVDWVVLTAGIIGIGIAVMLSITTGALSVSEDIDAKMQAVAAE